MCAEDWDDGIGISAHSPGKEKWREAPGPVCGVPVAVA